MASKYSNITIQGYRRENGRVGRSQSCPDPAARRYFQRRLRGGGQQHQGHAGRAPCLWPAAVRRGSGPAFPDDHRHRRKTRISPLVSLSVSSRGGRKKSSTGLPPTGKPVQGFSIEQNGDLKTIMDCQPRRQGDGAFCQRIAARGMFDFRTLDFDQMRRKRYHHRPRLLSDGWQHV